MSQIFTRKNDNNTNQPKYVQYCTSTILYNAVTRYCEETKNKQKNFKKTDNTPLQRDTMSAAVFSRRLWVAASF